MHAFWTLQTDSEASEEVGRQPPFTGLPRIAPAVIGLSRWLLNDPPKWWTRLRLGLHGIQEVTGSIPVSSTKFSRMRLGPDGRASMPRLPETGRKGAAYTFSVMRTSEWPSSLDTL